MGLFYKTNNPFEPILKNSLFEADFKSILLTMALSASIGSPPRPLGWPRSTLPRWRATRTRSGKKNVRKHSWVILGRAATMSRGNPRENIQRLSIGTLSQCHRILGVKMQFITHPHHQAPRKFRLLGTRFQVDQGHREPTETPRILGLLPGSQLRIPRRRGA